MNPIVYLALEAITHRTNLDTGLTNISDKNAAKEMLLLLHEAGEVLDPLEIADWCGANGWKPRDAKELATLGAKISEGRRLRMAGWRSWRPDIVDYLKAQAAHNKSTDVQPVG